MTASPTVTFLDETITAATSLTSTVIGDVPAWAKGLTLQANFVGGTGGTSVKAYIQTTLDDGETWVDIVSFGFTTTAIRKIANVNGLTQVTAMSTPTDGSLEDNAIVDGVLGTRMRTKYVTAGTYSSTSLKITGVYNK